MHTDPTPAPTVTTPPRSIGYPTNCIYAIVDTPAALDSVLAALGARSTDARARVLCCEVGRRRIGARSERASLLGRLVPVSALGIDADQAQPYDDALKAGRFVVEVYAREVSTRQRAVALLRANGAHCVTCYGPAAVETLAP